MNKIGCMLSVEEGGCCDVQEMSVRFYVTQILSFFLLSWKQSNLFTFSHVFIYLFLLIYLFLFIYLFIMAGSELPKKINFNGDHIL